MSYLKAQGANLCIGDRVRSKRHPELTGRIKNFEYQSPGKLSPIPYCIDWDDSGRASDLLGWFFVYASEDGLEALPDTPDLREGD